MYDISREGGERVGGVMKDMMCAVTIVGYLDGLEGLLELGAFVFLDRA